MTGEKEIADYERIQREMAKLIADLIAVSPFPGAST
jgi:hypothetical protein